MVATETENQISGIKLSSVVPAQVTGEDKNYELTNMDLAMKLHYIKAFYFFDKEAIQCFTIHDFKAPMFPWLNLYHQVSGRIRCTENGRPFIKCNDGGVRIVEAKCNKTVDEFLTEVDDHSVYNRLVYDPVLGPDLGFSPLVFLQFTWFKCGGISIGLSWSHILGDTFSASNFINMWAKIMSGHAPPQSLNVPDSDKPVYPSSFSDNPLSVKTVDPVGDRWITANNGKKMVTHSFRVTAKQLEQLKPSNIYDHHTNAAKISSFEIITAMIWRSMARIKGDSEPKIITICRKNSNYGENEILSNNQVLGTVEADFCVAKGGLEELSRLVAEKLTDEKMVIQKTIERNQGKSDFIVYGANLTFVDLEESNLYEMEIKKRKPVFVNYMIDGIGDEGIVLVIPRNSKDGTKERTLTVTLVERELVALKSELKKEWNIV